MKITKKLISVLLAAAMATACAVTAFAAGTSTDVAKNAYYAEAVEYALENGLISGTGEGRFSPNMNLSRGMLAAILWRSEGGPESESSTFSDVRSGAYYAVPIGWAAENGIVSGYGNHLFGPDDDIERQQLAAMLYRYADFKGEDVTVTENTPFADDSRISSYAKASVAWAREKGIIAGKGNNRFDPTGSATRAEAVAMVYRTLTMDRGESPAPDENEGGESSGGGTIPTPDPAPTPDGNDEEQEEPTMEKLKIEINGSTLLATFADNTSAEALKERLRSGSVTVSVSDYGGFEKVGSFGFDLPTNDARLTTVPGDVILYSGNQLTIHYGSNSWSYTRLAKIDDVTNLHAKLGQGTHTVVLSLG